MGDLFGGGGSTTKVQIPTWIQEPMQRGIARAEQMAQMGYQPYYGPEVAAFSPMQTAAMQSAADAATAFGMAPQMNVMASIPTPTEYVGGVRGYGSGDIFEQSVNEFQKRQPEQNQIYSNLFTGPRVNAIDYGQDTDQRPVMGLPGGKGGAGNGSPQTQGVSGYNPYANGQFTSFSNSNSTFNPFSGYDIPVTAGSGPIDQSTTSSSGGSAPVLTDRPYIEGQYPNGYPTTPSNPNGIPVGDQYQSGIIYGQDAYNQGQFYQPQQQTYDQAYYNPQVYQSQPMQVDSQMAFQNQGLIPQSNNTPDQSQAAAIDFWNQTQAALDTGDLNTASKFYDQYQAITGTKEPMYGLSALDSTKYNQVRFGNG